MSQADRPELAFTDDFGSVCLLLLLNERPAGRTELLRRLRTVGPATAAETGIDARLRELAWEGLIIATDPAGADAGERIYHLTTRAMSELSFAVDDLRSTHVLLGRFLSRCSERLCEQPVGAPRPHAVKAPAVLTPATPPR